MDDGRWAGRARRRCRQTVGAAVLLAARVARGDEPPASRSAEAPAASAEGELPKSASVANGPDEAPPARAPVPAGAVVSAGPGGVVTLGGYVEAFYSYNTNRPSNGITNYRGFDDRHNSVTLSNVVLDASWDAGPVDGRVTLQVGHTPNAYYAAEPVSPATGGAGASDASTWKYLQQAYLGYRVALGDGLLVQAGIFLSPVGVEAIAVKDNWNWSRSNLFVGLPFYHTGLRATQSFGERLNVTAAVYNGWNSVVDDNAGKSVALSGAYKVPDVLTVGGVYFGGPERPAGAPEGQPWRSLFDAYFELDAADPLAFIAEADAGFEATHFGTAHWEAAALYARWRAADWLYVAARGDRFWEHVPTSSDGSAAPIFFPARWLSSGTLTLDARPAPTLSVRLEYRHDQAASAMFFRGQVAAPAPGASATPNAEAQNTLLLGAVAWF